MRDIDCLFSKEKLIWNCEGKGRSLVIVKLTAEQYNQLQKTDPEDIKLLKDSSEYKIVSMPKHKKSALNLISKIF